MANPPPKRPPASTGKTAGKVASGPSSSHQRAVESCPPAVRRAYEQLGLTPDASSEMVATVYQGIIRRLEKAPPKELGPYARAFDLIRKYQSAAAAAQARKAAEEAAAESTATRDPLRHYLKSLGLPPDANLEQVKASLAATVQAFPYPKTRLERQQQDQIRRTYSTVLRMLEERARVIAIPRKRQIATVGAAVLLVLLLVIAATNLSMLRSLVVSYRPGDVLYRKADAVPFGTVVAFDPAHKFAAGPPVAAYQVQLRESGRKVWISRQSAVGGLRRSPRSNPTR